MKKLCALFILLLAQSASAQVKNSGSSLIITKPAGASSTTVAGGVYTPTIANIVNLDATPTANACQYLRVGSSVTVSCQLSADPTSGVTESSFTVTLPVASDFASVFQCAGAGNFPDTGVRAPANVYGDITNNICVVAWRPAGSAAGNIEFTFTYTII